MKIGIAGAGNIVKEFLTFAHEVTGMELRGICATPRAAERLQDMCRKYSIPHYYLSYEEMLQDEEMDTVYIAVPNHLHYEFCKQAIRMNKHVICEKPFTSNGREAKELADLARENRVMIVEAVSTIYLPNTIKIKELLPQLGQIKVVSCNYSQYSSRYDAFKQGEILPAFDPDMSGGALMDLNIYNINFVVTLFGAPQHWNYEANMERGIDTSGILTMDYGTFKCVCIAAKDCKAPVMTTIQGDKGCICIPSPVNCLNDFELYQNEDKAAKRLSRGVGKVYSCNEGKHRMYHEFKEFTGMIDNRDYGRAEAMLKTSLAIMDIQTKAREIAGIVFPADRLEG